MFPLKGIYAIPAWQALGKKLARSTKVLRAKIAITVRALNKIAQPVAVAAANNVGRQPIHPAALLRQSKRLPYSRGAGRWFSQASSSSRRFLSAPAGKRGFNSVDLASLPISHTSHLVAQSKGCAPFASLFRSNLTSRVLPRITGNYFRGGSRGPGTRYFSHTAITPAQVMRDVHMAARAFWLSGLNAQPDGSDASTGTMPFHPVSAQHKEARLRLEDALGHNPDMMGTESFVAFRISPIVTALSPLPYQTKKAVDVNSLNDERFLRVLSGDFAHAIHHLDAVLGDLQRLASLGDLPITLDDNGSLIRVHFPGVDRDTAERLCDDVGVSRGTIGQNFDYMDNDDHDKKSSLRFPFAPDDFGGGVLARSRVSSEKGESISNMTEPFLYDEFDANPWLHLATSSSSKGSGGSITSGPVGHQNGGFESLSGCSPSSSDDFEGLEGIYRFLGACDRARGRYRG